MKLLIVRQAWGSKFRADDVDGVPAGTSRSWSRSALWSRTQPCDTIAPVVPIAASEPKGPWMAVMASPDSSQSLMVLLWAEVTITKAP